MSRRQDVANIQPGQEHHAGLWLDKFIKGFEKEPTVKQTPQAELVAQVAAILMPNAYNHFYERWVETLHLVGVVEKHMRKATVQGRLSIGLGGEAVLETAITLHRTYGVPYIPGSALKGLAANYARNKLDARSWGVKSEAYTTLFGDTESAGYVTFFDALYVPATGHQGKPLWPDIITVHHPNYYQGNEPPADWDSPTPVPFLSATGAYLIALAGQDDWVATTFEILALALAEEGIGAKTSSGYGRMAIEGMAVAIETTETNVPITPPKPEAVERRGVIVRIDATRGGNVRDSGTTEEFHFAISAIKGDFPGKGNPVIFKTQGAEVVYLKRA